MAERSLTMPDREPRLPRMLSVWFLPLLWIAMIGFGGTDRLSAGHTYVLLARLLAALHLHVRNLALLNAELRKVGHFCVYGALSLLLFRAWRQTFAMRLLHALPRGRYRIPSWKPSFMLLALLGAVVVASLDEWHQTFVPSRTGVVHDVFLDFFGAFFFQMVLLVALIGRRRTVTHD